MSSLVDYMFQAEMTAKRLYWVIGMELRLQELQEEDGQAQRIKVGKLGKKGWDDGGLDHQEISYVS